MDASGDTLWGAHFEGLRDHCLAHLMDNPLDHLCDPLISLGRVDERPFWSGVYAFAGHDPPSVFRLISLCNYLSLQVLIECPGRQQSGPQGPRGPARATHQIARGHPEFTWSRDQKWRVAERLIWQGGCALTARSWLKDAVDAFCLGEQGGTADGQEKEDTCQQADPGLSSFTNSEHSHEP